MRRIVVDPKARKLIDKAFKYYVEEIGDFDLALRFLDNTYALFDDLARHPGMGTLWESDNLRLKGIRVFGVYDFPHRIFYRVTADTVNIRYILHSSRDIRNLP